tara:strand:- start:201 stop:485 length:285 start_codon:yes stop_codon:yes gene_type:complete
MGIYLDLVRDILSKDNTDNKNNLNNENTINKQFLHGSSYELNELNEISPSLTADELEEYQERASIMEFDGNMPRDKAERLALERIMRKRKHLLN